MSGDYEIKIKATKEGTGSKLVDIKAAKGIKRCDELVNKYEAYILQTLAERMVEMTYVTETAVYIGLKHIFGYDEFSQVRASDYIMIRDWLVCASIGKDERSIH